jgi:hypothetical protein
MAADPQTPSEIKPRASQRFPPLVLIVTPKERSWESEFSTAVAIVACGKRAVVRHPIDTSLFRRAGHPAAEWLVLTVDVQAESSEPRGVLFPERILRSRLAWAKKTLL